MSDNTPFRQHTKYVFVRNDKSKHEMSSSLFFASIEKNTGLDEVIALAAIHSNGSIEHPLGKWIIEKGV